MATTRKTTVRRFNGVDWDAIHFSTSADIVALGAATTITGEETAFQINDVLGAEETMYALMARAINRMATVDNVVIPSIKNGTGIDKVYASTIDGVIARANLPVDVSGKGVEVASEDAKAALTAEDVNQGDVVKVTGGAVYLVTGATAEGVTYMTLTDETSAVAWSRVTGTPTTLAGYGITDAVNKADLASAGGADAANKVAKANADGKLAFDITGDAATLGGHDADYFAAASRVQTVEEIVGNNDSDTGLVADVKALQNGMQNIDASQIKTGVLDIALIPKAAIEHMYVVASEAELANLTTAQVQNGDTVKIADADDVIGKMYFVTDETKLGTADYMQGLMAYSAGTAAAVDWSGVQNKPTTLAGYGITDAVASNMLVTEASAANAGKVLVLDATGKLPVSITGDAATLEGHNAAYFATADAHNTLAGTVQQIAEIVLGVEGGEATVVERVQALEDAMGNAETEGTVLYNIAQLKSGAGIQALDASKLTGTIDAARLPDIAWSKITGTPTTLAGYGITDAVNSNMLVDVASVENAGKILKIGADGKLNASITGDAATLGGHAADYFATAKALSDLALSVPVLVSSTDELADAAVGQMALVEIASV